MAEPGGFARVDRRFWGETNTGHEKEPWQVCYHPRNATEVEKFYRERFVRAAERLRLGPVEVCRPNDPVDLVIAGHACELKVARAREKNNGLGYRAAEFYQGNLHDPAKRRHLDGDVVILLCVDYEDRLWPFVVPRLLVGNRRTIEITSHPTKYAGQWAPFLEAFEYVAPA